MCGLKNTMEGSGVVVSECRIRVSGWVGVGVMIKGLRLALALELGLGWGWSWG